VRKMRERILYIDLTEQSTKVVEGGELFKKYLGGPGVGSKLLLEECPPRVDPFSPEAPVIFTVGALTAVFPCMVKAFAFFKSPLTGNLGESHAGGHLATALTLAGYGAVVVKGAAEKPSVLRISDEEVKLEQASSLWGVSTFQVEKTLRGSPEGMRSVVSIGRAGENLVYYAGALVDRYHHFGRLGLGAVLGSKKLKALQVTGTRERPLKKADEAKALYEEFHRKIVEGEVMAKYHNLGTPENLLVLNEMGALPTRNFQKPRFEGVEKISGDVYAEAFLRRKISCPGCPVACIHVARLAVPFAPEHEKARREIFTEEFQVPYNYEPMYALGSNLEISDPEGLLRLIFLCEYHALDAMIAGNVLAWATEAYEKGLVSREDSLGVVPRWGDWESYARMLENIVETRNPFYAKLAQGVKAAAEKYGGLDFAMNLGKNGPAGYMTGPAFIVGGLVGARHSHLSNAGYSVDQRALKKPLTPREMAERLVAEENWLYVLYSLGACYFSRRVYTEEAVVKALKAEGVETTVEELKALGRKIFHNLYKFKLQEGFRPSFKDVPGRFFEGETSLGKLEPSQVEEILSHYVKLRRREGLKLVPEEKMLMDLLAPKKSRGEET